MGGGAGWDGIMGKHTIFMSCDPFFSFLHIVLLIHMHIIIIIFLYALRCHIVHYFLERATLNFFFT